MASDRFEKEKQALSRVRNKISQELDYVVAYGPSAERIAILADLYAVERGILGAIHGN